MDRLDERRERSMTTAAPRHDGAATPQEIDERTQSAWAEYSQVLRDLTGRDYDDAEHEAWAKLQEALAALGEQSDGPAADAELPTAPA